MILQGPYLKPDLPPFPSSHFFLTKSRYVALANLELTSYPPALASCLGLQVTSTVLNGGPVLPEANPS